MPSYMMNKGKADVATVGWPNGDYRVMVVDTPPASQAAAEDLNFVADVVIDEVPGAARQALTTKQVIENDTDNRAELDADDPAAYTGLDGPVMAGLYVLRVVTNDADSPLIAFLDYADVTTNGGDVAVAFAAAGVLNLS